VNYFHQIVGKILILSLFLCSIPQMSESTDLQIRRRNPRATMNRDNIDSGLKFRLSESSEQPEKIDAVKSTSSTPLSEDQIQNVLRRLSPIKEKADDTQDFKLRESSLPAPKTGNIISTQFPIRETREGMEQPTSGPLEVLRFSPTGDVPIAPQLSVTFSQPMVPVTSHADISKMDLPVKISPQPSGRWRWIGTKTLLFEAENNRLPMATQYTVEVPAGTKSATGGTLPNAKSWSFTTPPPTVKRFHPNGGVYNRGPLMFVEFDQQIDRDAVLQTIRVRAGREEFKVRLATAEEIEGDASVRSFSSQAMKDRWLAFRVVGEDLLKALPGDSDITVSIGPGTPSAEGPLKTIKSQDFYFRTFGPLRIVEHRCGWEKNCSPFDQWTIRFSNPLDAKAFQSSQLKIEPEIPGIKSSVYYDSITISGLKKGQTTYRVTVSGSIKDQFEQTLGKDQTVSFKVGSAPQSLTSSGENFVVIDPYGSPQFSVYSINLPKLKVSLYSATSDHWYQYMEYLADLHSSQKKKSLPGALISSKIIDVAGQPDEMAETRIDLAPALKGNRYGHVIIVVEPTVRIREYGIEKIVRWAQVTNIGLDAFVDHSNLLGWATSLKDGTPLRDTQLTIQPNGIASTTDQQGLARIPLNSRVENRSSILIARRGEDSAILPENSGWWAQSSSWNKRELIDSIRWYVFDDRKMYRPGEEVHIKGWMRRIGAGPTGDVELISSANVPGINYTLRDSRGNDITKGKIKVNLFGGFDTVLKLPPTINLGYTSLYLEAIGGGALSDSSYNHSFQVQEFRRPEFEVTATGSEGPHFVGGHAESVVTASYYAGGGLPNAEVRWNVTSTPGYFTPPNREDFTFGKWTPWWWGDSSEGASRTETFAGQTDASGKHRLRIDFVSANPPRAYNIKAEATVTDVNRQAWTASSNMLVHPASLYVGLRSKRTFVQKGELLEVESIVTDLDGNAIAGRTIKMQAVLLDWVFENGEWKQKEVNPQDCTIQSTSDVVKCKFNSKEGGTYRVRATIADDQERENESELTLWVAGGKVPPKRDIEREKVELIPDHKEYKVGEVAEVLVQSPFYPADGVMTLRRSGLVKTEHFRMDSSSYTLRIPIDQTYLPNIHIQVDLTGATARTNDAGMSDSRLPKRPAFASGTLNLKIPPIARKLSVKAVPKDKALEPGGETSVDIEVLDAANRPVANSEVAVVVVDESVLALTGYRIGNPMDVFYSDRNPDVRDYYLRDKILLSNPKDLADKMQTTINIPYEAVQVGAAGGAGGGGREERVARRAKVMALPAPAMMKQAEGMMADAANEPAETIRVRENFNALAVFAASVPTDSNGHASVPVKVPDNLTRYRIMAVSVAGGKQFGTGESTITARLPLMVRPSAPRFLNFGDKFELPIVVQNQTDNPIDVDVAVRASNVQLTSGNGRRVTVPANDRVEVRFPTATSRAGIARFQIGVLSGKWTDAAEIELPVWTPATTEAFATYGEVDKGAIIQPVQAPSDVFKQFGGIEVTTSSTQLQELTDAVLYLVSYPFECSEQLASRILAVAALRDVLTAFESKDLPSPTEINSAVERDIKRLQGLQQDNGGFGFWRRNERNWPYVSIHVAHALQRARMKDYKVPNEMLDRSKNYLRNIENHIPSNYGRSSRNALKAYALYVRNLMGDRDTAKARKLIAEEKLETLSLESLGWLLSVLSGDPKSQVEVEAIRNLFNNKVAETAATAHFVTSYSDDNYLLLHSDRRTDGVILEALIGDQPGSDLIPKIVRGLLAHRTKGRWENTQENVFILLALDRYFATYEKTAPNFIARVWLGDRYAGENQFKGRTTDSHLINIPMQILAGTQGGQNLAIAKEGDGRLYYRIGMKYAPTSLKLDPVDHGFTVERVYEAIDNPEDVRRDADGTWHIKAGAKVRVKLTMVANARRYHVALVDPIPAGLEALNPALAVTGTIPEETQQNISNRNSWWWWARPWFEHQNMRDERVEAFSSLLWEGVYTYSYVARATTPGDFVVPPAKAEEMYHPETFGRGGTDRVKVESNK
jgi:alpha-2-macroglobulin